MRTKIWMLAMIAALSVMGSQVAVADESKAASSEVVAGTVTKIDSDRRRVTVRAADGKMYEFQASEETLRDLKEGDRIEAKKREDGT
jgi:Cu/Ag efflux protein CusF